MFLDKRPFVVNYVACNIVCSNLNLNAIILVTKVHATITRTAPCTV